MRNITLALSDALANKIVRPVHMLRIEHPSGTLRLWTGIGTLNYGGFPWTGANTVVSLSAIEEGTEIQVLQAQLQMPAPVNSDEAMALVLSPARRVPVYRWLAFLDSNSNVIPDPILRAKMFGDPPKIQDDGNGNQIVTMAVEGAVFNLSKGSDTLLSNEEQLSRFPGDTGLGRMAEIVSQQLTWTAGAYNSFTPPP